MPFIPNTIISRGSDGGSGDVTKIYDSLLAVDTANFDVTDLSGSHIHLKLCLMARANNAVATQNAWMRFNNDSTTSEYSYVSQQLSGAANQTAIYIGLTTGSSATANMPSTHDIFIPNYKDTLFIQHVQTYTGFLNEGVNSGQDSITGFYSESVEITRLTIFPNAGSWLAGSRLTVYGLS